VIRGRARRRSIDSPGSRERGQALVEFALILPMFMMLLLGLVEFGFIFANHQGLEYATREGARTAAALANGQNGQNGLPSATTCTTIDNQVIAAVQRLITGKGSPVTLADVSQIRLYKYDDATSGPVAGYINVWTPGVGPVVDGTALNFKWTSGTWNACTRANGATPDSIAVEVTYGYTMKTGLGAMLKWVGANTLAMTDKTVMVLNP
jgi:Flp pilus assembly protein TadG